MRLRGLLACLLVGVGCTWAAPVASAAAGPRIRMIKIQYDSPGTDTRTNASLNAEYVLLKNVGTGSGNLRGYTLRDVANHVHTFGSFTLKPNQSVYVRTGKGGTSATSIYWGSGSYIWNNTGDTAYLRSAGGALLQTCRWTSRGAGFKTCTY